MRKYHKSGQDFKQGAVQLVVETGKPIAQMAPGLGVEKRDQQSWGTGRTCSGRHPDADNVAGPGPGRWRRF